MQHICKLHQKSWGFEFLLSVLSYARDENKCDVDDYIINYAYVFKGIPCLVFEPRFSITLRNSSESKSAPREPFFFLFCLNMVHFDTIFIKRWGYIVQLYILCA